MNFPTFRFLECSCQYLVNTSWRNGVHISRIPYLKTIVRAARVLSFLVQYYIRKFLFLFRVRLPVLKRLYVNTFPSVHLKKMDAWDYAWLLSSELLVAVIVLLVAGFNVMGLGLQDKSIASAFLSLHVDQNPKLYAHNTATKKLVTRHTGFIAPAFADSAIALEQTEEPLPEAGLDTPVIVTDTGLEAQNPDSVRDLLKKQIKVYTTKEGDTLGSIARSFNISIDTVKWANNLPNNTIKPGWHLIILPKNGLLIKATSNTTLPDIAAKFNGNLEQIIAYNGLANAEDISEDDYIICPDCIVPLPPAPKPTPKPLPKPTTRTYGIVADADDGKAIPGKGHIFPKGYCTWYVASRRYVPWGGNAKSWLKNAQSYGFETGSNPAPGAIVVTTDNRYYGHVALVEKVSGGKILVSEMNYEKFNRTNQRWIDIDSKTIRGYIY